MHAKISVGFPPAGVVAERGGHRDVGTSGTDRRECAEMMSSMNGVSGVLGRLEAGAARLQVDDEDLDIDVDASGRERDGEGASGDEGREGYRDSSGDEINDDNKDDGGKPETSNGLSVARQGLYGGFGPLYRWAFGAML